MRRLIAISIGMFLSAGLVPARAESVSYTCETIGLRGLRPPAARLEIDLQAATTMVVHIKRACDKMAVLQKDHPDPSVRRPLTLMGAQLNAFVLAPLYREYPNLRRLTAAEELPKTPKQKPGARPVPIMGSASATYLRWALSNIQRHTSGVADSMCKGAGESCFHPLLDLGAEIGFAEKPVYASYPRLFLLDMKETDRRTPNRTATSDAAFRKEAAKAGAVTVTPVALKVARDFLNALRTDDRKRCEVGAFTWTLDGESKGPDDKEWTKSGPGVSFGSFPCRELPPDVVRRIDGLSIMIAGPQFADKIIDWENHKFVLRDRGFAPKR